jgi:hypothetical protein
MKEYLFRVLIDTKEDEEIFRDIAINSDANFELLHTAIINAFQFSGKQMASFYLSDEEWNKGDEIGLMDMSGDGNIFHLMKSTPLEKLATEVGQKILYVYDFLNMWCFFVELVEINTIDEENRYPYLELSFGTAPREESKDVMNDLYADAGLYEEEEEDDEYNDMQFENIDDYDF